MNVMRRYGIIGTGALGGFYGGLLARSGIETHFLLNSDYDHVRQHGLRVDTKLGDFHLADINAHKDPEQMPACDVTIVAIKTTMNHLLPQLLSGATRGGGCALVLQNGLHVEQDTVDIVGANRVLGGCCFLCSNKVGPGHIHHMDYGRIAFGEYRADSHVIEISDRASQIESDLRQAGITADAVDDLIKVRWQKLMWNIPFNGLSVALDASTSEIMKDPHAEQLAEAIIRDVRAAAAICGKKIDESFVDKMMNDTRAMVPYDSSMRIDFKNKRPMEIEAIFGNPLREIDKFGGTAPRLTMLYQQLHFLGNKNQ